MVTNLESIEMFKEQIGDYTLPEWKMLSSKPVILDFYTQSCTNCKLLGMFLNKTPIEAIDVIKIDCDQFMDIAQVFNVMKLPAVIYLTPDNDMLQVSDIAIQPIDIIKKLKELETGYIESGK